MYVVGQLRGRQTSTCCGQKAVGGCLRPVGGAIGGRLHGLILARQRRVQSALQGALAVIFALRVYSSLTPDAKPADLCYTPIEPLLAPSCLLSPMSGQAVRFVAAAAAKSSTATIQLLCHVKPGVSANREGIAAISEERIQVCVAAQARDGEANRAVMRVVADALGVAKSDVEVIKGMKSRDKTVAVRTSLQDPPEEQMERTKDLLRRNASM
jgi:uncharacterized protein (TIGR00251 family)